MDLLEGFERWDRKSAPHTTEPMVTIQKGGIFSLNKAALDAMGTPAMVELFYNAERRIIAFKTADERSLDAYPPRQQGAQANYYVAGQLFTKHHKIDTEVARRYPVTAQNGILFLDLNGPSQVATGVRARAKAAEGESSG